jgi:hypothetical protein
LRYWTASSRDLTAQVQTIIRRTIAQYYVTQAVKRGAERHKVQPRSVTFVQRFGGSLNLNVHYHVIVMEGVFVDRMEQGRKPRFLQVEPPSDADVAEVVQKISRRIILTGQPTSDWMLNLQILTSGGYRYAPAPPHH